MATKLAQFLLLPLYTTVLAPAEYGAVDYLNTIALFCVPVASLLMDEALFRFLIDCKTEGDRRQAVTATVGVLGIGCILFATLMGAPPTYLPSRELLVDCWPCLCWRSFTNGFRFAPRFWRYNGLCACEMFRASAVMIILNVIFIAGLRWGVNGMLAATVIAQGGTALVFALRRRVWRLIDLRDLSRNYMKQLLKDLGSSYSK